MKRYFQILAVMCILLTSTVVNAQNQRRFPAMRERILNAKYNEICMQMGLPKPIADELKPTYLRYEREKSQLLLDRPAQADLSDSTLTDKQEEDRCEHYRKRCQ